MNDDIILEFLEKLCKNPDNINVNHNNKQVTFQEPNNPYKFVYYKETTYPYKGERINIDVYENDQKLYEFLVDAQKMYKLAEKVFYFKVSVLKTYINNFLES